MNPVTRDKLAGILVEAGIQLPGMDPSLKALLEDDKNEDHTPWYIQALQVAGAWLAAILFIVFFFGSLLSGIRNEIVYVVVGLMVFHPVASWLEDWLEGLLIRDRGDYRTVLRRLAREVATVLKLDELAAYVVEMLQTSLMVDRAMFLVRGGPGAGNELAREKGHQGQQGDQAQNDMDLHHQSP